MNKNLWIVIFSVFTLMGASFWVGSTIAYSNEDSNTTFEVARSRDSIWERLFDTNSNNYNRGNYNNNRRYERSNDYNWNNSRNSNSKSRNRNRNNRNNYRNYNY